MIIRKNIPKPLGLNEPIRHNSHSRPVTRRDFVAQGFMTGAATVLATPLLAALLKPGLPVGNKNDSLDNNVDASRPY